jgi:hypothetical protein
VKGVEGFAEIFGHKNVRVIVIGAVSIETDIDSTLEVPGGFDRRYVAWAG